MENEHRELVSDERLLKLERVQDVTGSYFEVIGNWRMRFTNPHNAREFIRALDDVVRSFHSKVL